MDVWRLFTDQSFYVQDYIAKGDINVKRRHMLPPNPLIEQEIQRELARKVNGNGKG